MEAVPLLEHMGILEMLLQQLLHLLHLWTERVRQKIHDLQFHGIVKWFNFFSGIINFI